MTGLLQDSDSIEANRASNRVDPHVRKIVRQRDRVYWSKVHHQTGNTGQLGTSAHASNITYGALDSFSKLDIGRPALQGGPISIENISHSFLIVKMYRNFFPPIDR